MNLLTFPVTTLLAVISTAQAQEQIYNQIQASRGADPGAPAAGGGSPYQHRHHDHERQKQQEQRAQQLRGGRGGRHPSALFLEAVEVSCTNYCNTFIKDCFPGYTCNDVGSPYYPAFACEK